MSVENLNSNTTIAEIEDVPARSMPIAVAAPDVPVEPETRISKLEEEILTLRTLLSSQAESVQRISDRFLAQDMANQNRSSDRERERAHPDRRTRDEKKAEFYADRSRLTYLKVLHYENKIQKAALIKLEEEAAFRREQEEKNKAAALAETARTGVPSIYEPIAYMMAMANAPVMKHGCKPMPMGPGNSGTPK